MNEETQPLTEHLTELRRRVIWVLLTFLVSLIVSFIYATDLFEFIKNDAIGSNVKLYVFNPSDALMVYVQIAMICSMVFTLPVILYHIWQFVKPGLRSHEQKNAGLYIPASFFLFLGGLAFGYYVVFPMLYQFMANLAEQMHVTEQYGVYQYFDFMVSVIVPLALLFELPVVVLFLTRLKLITPSLLHKIRRVAYFAMVVISTLIAPPYITTNLIIAIPLIVLYEISVLISIWQYKRIEAEEKSWEGEDIQDDHSESSS
ncbi:sec-independent protein translocase protein TatC [Croceifilum oryzae]|uniref:Sec-independent protein translocase protein TatC n=1 Tax=Croceifilum oryzae TaxID=1553429 RepID=A0AAJ1WRD5_9BACL|nr:twin-arginine translocase subunit TatC [Croceifilum oryzae]MDQ0418407.1 sec-independent protein translocase protein TatC [Croceifilum oryzae]